MTPDPHEALVEDVARAIAQVDEQNGAAPYEYRITLGKHAKTQLFEPARAAIAIIAERTKEATEDQLKAVRQLDEKRPEMSDDDVIGYGWSVLHSRSALYPRKGE